MAKADLISEKAKRNHHECVIKLIVKGQILLLQ